MAHYRTSMFLFPISSCLTWRRTSYQRRWTWVWCACTSRPCMAPPCGPPGAHCCTWWPYTTLTGETALVFWYLTVEWWSSLWRSAVHKNHNSVPPTFRVIALSLFVILYFCLAHTFETRWRWTNLFFLNQCKITVTQLCQSNWHLFKWFLTNYVYNIFFQVHVHPGRPPQTAAPVHAYQHSQVKQSGILLLATLLLV